MKVAFVRPPSVHAYWKTQRPLLGVAYLVAHLESKGIACAVFDANFCTWSEEELLARVLAYTPDLIGISSMTHEIVRAHEIARRIRAVMPHIPIVVGGCHATALPQKTLEQFPAFSAAVYGEGEKTIEEIVAAIKNGPNVSFEGILGMAYRMRDGSLKTNPPRPRLSNEELDELSRPALHHYYDRPDALSDTDDWYVMLTSRGCPYQCAFCMQVLGHEVRRRSPEKVVDEIEFAVCNYGAHTIYFADEIFLFDDKHTHAILDLMIQRGIHKKIKWRCSTRINIVTETLLAKAKAAGCWALELGVESGNDEILRNIQKNITREQVVRAVSMIKKSKIFAEALFILGHPNETRKTIRQTIDFAASLNTDAIAVGIMTPYPGTKVYEMAKKGEGGYRLLSTDWSDYDKYGGRSLELKDIPLKELEMYQRQALLLFYCKNFRFADLAKFVFRYWKTISRLIINSWRHHSK